MVCCVVRGRAKGRTGSGREIQAGAGQVLPGGSPLHKDLKEAKTEPQRHWEG